MTHYFDLIDAAIYLLPVTAAVSFLAVLTIRSLPRFSH
jgi:hypothetical protein